MTKRQINPFKPTAGAEPPVLAGRERVIDDFNDGLDEGPGAPGRLMRITGPRGSGKTVLLTELGDIARKRGWLVVDETAQKGFLDRLTATLSTEKPNAALSADFDMGPIKAHAGLNGVSASLNFRSALSHAATKPGKKGVMITVDEVQDADRDDMAEIATAVQHLIREGKNVIFAFAGITTGVLDFINDSTLTFLRRAKPEELAAIPTHAVEDAFRKSFDESGMSISGTTLETAAKATHGYAFLIQLVGYNVWKICRRHLDESNVVRASDVEEGMREAFAQYDDMVIAPALAGLSERAMHYLLAMAKNDGATATRAIAEELGIVPSSLTSVRKTLIARQIVEPTTRGYVDFSIPRMREYLNDNADELLAWFG